MGAAFEEGEERVALVQAHLAAEDDVQLFSRLALGEFGPGYIHFPRDLDDEYFRQLTAEKLMTKHIKGVAVRV